MNVVFGVGGFLLQFFPMSVFLRTALLNGKPQASDWLYAFMWGGSASILHLALLTFFSRDKPLNRIILGVNLYLIIGGIAVVTNQTALLNLLKILKESGIFLCLLVVGVSTTFASKAGFVGVTEPSMSKDIRSYSIWLIILTCAAITASFLFKGQMIVSAAAPLISLSAAVQLFKRRLQLGYWL